MGHHVDQSSSSFGGLCGLCLGLWLVGVTLFTKPLITTSNFTIVMICRLALRRPGDGVRPAGDAEDARAEEQEDHRVRRRHQEEGQ